MIKAIIFDFFGVISSEVSPFWFAERYEHEKALELKEKYMSLSDRGDVSENETFESLSRLSGESAADIRADFTRRAVINQDTVELIKLLKSNYKIVLLSNAMGTWLRGILEKNSLPELFDEIIISSEVRLIKPEPEIFNLALSRIGVQADEAIFLDDNKANADGASAIGLHGIVFTDAENAKIELLAKGIKI